MSLASAIERARKNGHENLGLGFDAFEFPEIEQGILMLSELGPWLVDRYSGRVAFWRLQCTKIDIEKPGQKNRAEVILAAEVLIQTYADLFLEERLLLFPEVEGRQVMVFPKLPVWADEGSTLLGGWRFGDHYHSLREHGGLLRLAVKLVANREIWSMPEIRLDTNLSWVRPYGALANLADLSDPAVWSGGLEMGIARALAKKVVPAIDLKIGSTRFR